MARILYGVMGNTHGHIMRSLAIASRLAGEHEFHFVGGGHVPAAVAGKYPCLEVPVLRTAAHHRGRVSVLRAAGQIAARVTEIPQVKSKIRALIRSWKPDLAICDREFFLPFACQASGLRCVSIDHSHLLVACDYEVPSDQKISWALAYGSDRALFDRTRENLIVSFYHPPLRAGRTDELLPPVLRWIVTQISPQPGDHVVCYQTSSTSRAVVEMLRGCGREVRIYGFRPERETRDGNLVFRSYDDRRILEDLSTCAYAVANGGHNLLCEALHYGKPVLCFPVPMLFEQFLNSAQIRALGFGDYSTMSKPGEGIVRTFEARLDQFRANLAGKTFDGTAEVVERVRALLSR
jgi:uncharacterized protein (TIGR00661 family)